MGTVIYGHCGGLMWWVFASCCGTMVGCEESTRNRSSKVRISETEVPGGSIPINSSEPWYQEKNR
jgi:hypothetical protein